MKRTLLVWALFVTGCTGGTASSVAQSLPTSASESPVVKEIPTAAPIVAPAPTEDLKAIAAAAYLAAVTKLNDGLRRANAYCAKNTLSSQHKCFSRAFNSEEAFLLEVRAITFPDAIVDDAKAVIRAHSEADALAREAYGSSSLNQILYELWPKYTSAQEAGRAASNVLRGDLGLPPVPNSL